MKNVITVKKLERIRKHPELVIWDWISILKTLSENSIRIFQDKVDLVEISAEQILSEDFIKEFLNKIDTDTVHYN